MSSSTELNLSWIERVRRKWYQLRWGSEEAEKLIRLKGKELAVRLAILEEHGPFLADHLFEQRQDEVATRSRNRQAAKYFTREINERLRPTAKFEQIGAEAGEASLRSQETRDKLKPSVAEIELVTMRENAIEAITCKNQTEVQLSGLRKREAELKALLKKLPNDDPRRPGAESQLQNVASVLPDLERHFKDLSQEVERMKRDVRIKERSLKSQRAAST